MRTLDSRSSPWTPSARLPASLPGKSVSYFQRLEQPPLTPGCSQSVGLTRCSGRALGQRDCRRWNNSSGGPALVPELTLSPKSPTFHTSHRHSLISTGSGRKMGSTSRHRSGQRFRFGKRRCHSRQAASQYHHKFRFQHLCCLQVFHEEHSPKDDETDRRVKNSRFQDCRSLRAWQGILGRGRGEGFLAPFGMTARQGTWNFRAIASAASGGIVRAGSRGGGATGSPAGCAGIPTGAGRSAGMPAAGSP